MVKKQWIILATVVMMSLPIAASAQGGLLGGGRGGDGGRGGAPFGEMGFPMRGEGVLMDAMALLHEATGLTPAETMTEIRAGKTLSELIVANGGVVEAVKAEAIALITEQVNQAVTEGTITQERADALLLNIDVQIDSVLSGETRLGDIRDNIEERVQGRMNDRRNNRPEARVLTAIVDATGLTQAEVREQLQAGTTPEAILTEAGVDINTFVDETLAPVKEDLDAKVAEGTISQALADARLNLWRVELLERLAKVHTPR